MSKYTGLLPLLFRAKLNPSSTCVQKVRSSAVISAQKEISYFDESSLEAAKPFEELPSLRILPWVGTGWFFLPIIGRFKPPQQIEATRAKRKLLGDIYREKFGPRHFVVTFSADDLKILLDYEGVYPVRSELQSLKAYRESRKKSFPHKGIFITQGEEWHDLRTKTQKHLMKPKAIQAFLDPMQTVARDLAQKILKVRDSNNEVPDFQVELNKWALESVALVGLDSRLGCLDINLPPDSDGMKMINSVQTLFECMNSLEAFSGNLQLWKYFPTPKWNKFCKASDTFTEITFKHINQSLENLKKKTNEDAELTLLQSMLMTKGMDASKAMVMVSDMLMAGIDTTSYTVGYFLYHMARNPDKQELLHQHITSLLPRKEDRITKSVFNEMKYLKACMKESQRLIPAVLFPPRRLDRDVIFSGYRIPAGTNIIVFTLDIFKDEKHFPNPNAYLPERWLSKDENFHPYAFLPFGFGLRSCIGRRLAELEIICGITEVIRNFRIEYHYEDIGLLSRLIISPDRPLKFKFIERK